MKKYIKPGFKQMKLYFGLMGIAFMALSLIYCDPACMTNSYYVDIIVKKNDAKFPYKVCYYKELASGTIKDRCLFEEGIGVDTMITSQGGVSESRDMCVMGSRGEVKKAVYSVIPKIFDSLIILDVDNTILAKFYWDKYGEKIKPDYIKEGYKFKNPTDYKNNWEVGINEDNYPKWDKHVAYAIFEFEELE